MASASLIATASQAQVRIAPEVGLNLTKFTGADRYDNDEFRMGWKLGLSADFGVAPGLSIAPGLFYSTKGTNNDLDDLRINTYTHIGYLEIPVNAVYRFPVAGAGNFFISAGPYLGVALHGKSSYSLGDITYENDLTFGNGSGEMNPIDIGINAGLGYELPQGLFLKAQYGQGFTSLTESYKTNNQNIQFSIGYNLRTY